MPSRVITRPGSRVTSASAEGWCAERGIADLDQPGHHPRRREADRVGAVPGGREVDDAELHPGDGVEDRRGPADPVVHDRGVVLGAEHHRGLGQPVGQVERVGADRLVVPAATGHEVHGLRLAAHHPAAVGPQDPGVGVGHRDDEVAVLGGAAQLLLDVLHRRLQRRVAPDRRDLRLVGERRLLHVDRDRGLRPRPRREDLGADQRLDLVTVLDEARPRLARRPDASCSAHPAPQREATPAP